MNESLKKRQVLLTSLGNTLEWFDYGLFIYFAPLIGQKFFPLEGYGNATLAAFGVFAIGFIFRPLGGILFGHAGDTQGRAHTLRISILAISIPTLVIGLIPSYETIGWPAPVLFTILRMMQGISIGGEYSGIMIYLAESAPAKKRGFFTSFAAIGANCGFLLAIIVYMGLNSMLDSQAITDWAWRIPFISAGLAGSLLLYYRFQLAETPIFASLRAARILEKKPLISALKLSYGPLLKILTLTGMGSTLYYIFFAFLPKQINSQSLFAQSISLLAMLFLVPVAGYFGDRFGRKRMLMLSTFSTILFAIPIFQLLFSESTSYVIFAFALATCISSLEQGNTLCAAVENCPANVRYSGIAFSYNLGNALFGGTAPIIASLLSENFGPLAPAQYLMLLALMSFLAASTLLSKKDQAPSLSPEEA